MEIRRVKFLFMSVGKWEWIDLDIQQLLISTWIFFLIYQEETKNITVEETCQTCGSTGIMNMTSKVLQNPSYGLRIT